MLKTPKTKTDETKTDDGAERCTCGCWARLAKRDSEDEASAAKTGDAAQRKPAAGKAKRSSSRTKSPITPDGRRPA